MLFRSIPTRGFAREVRDLILRAQERGLQPKDLEQISKEMADENLWESAARFWDSYLNNLSLENAGIDAAWRVDSSQIVNKANSELEKNAELVDKLRNQFKYILVDEFQESDASQRRLLMKLASAELTLFIDSDSAIGAFRGADPEGAITFIKENKFEIISLPINYRSFKELNEDRKSTRLNSSHIPLSRMPSSA